MPIDAVMEKMLTAIIDGQSVLTVEVKQIQSDMSKLLVIEERQVNQKEALSRIGSHVDKVEATAKENYTETHTRINAIEQQVTDLRIMSARVVVKISMIAAGASAVVASLLAFFFNKMGG